VFKINLAGKAPDGSYQLRSLHFSGLRVHQAFSFITPNGTFTQVEYKTLYGPLTLVQSPKSATTLSSTTSAPAPSVSVEIVPVIMNGTTSHGANWFVSKDPKGIAYTIHVEFADSSIDTSVPTRVPTSVIQNVVEELY
jgi:hypothetical protein